MEDPRLVYAGSWQNITYDALTYRFSKTPGSTITFPFSGESIFCTFNSLMTILGYAIYVWGTTDLYTSKLSVSLDGQTHDMPAPSSGYPDPHCMLWYQAGLDQDTQHTVTVTNTESTGLVIQGFTVTRLVDLLK